MGRLVPFKQPKILLRCWQKSAFLRQHRLVIVGDGPELPELRRYIDGHQLADCVELTGAISFDEVKGWMDRSDIFAFPSIREQGGGVITMASMASKPSVVVDYGGPSCRVPQGCGIKVPLGSEDEIVDGFVAALEGLISDRSKIESLGRGARKFTEKYYSWTWKAEKTMEVYDWVLGRQEDKPDYWSENIGKRQLNSEGGAIHDVAAEAAKISF